MCTRVTYLGPDDLVITARSMDWFEDMRTDLWAFPRGMERDGAAGSRSVRWTSKYGSVIAAAYDIGTADGLNEAGLAANLLYLVEAGYPQDDGKRPTLCISTWPQYVLDNFASVAETVEALAPDPFVLLAPDLPNGKASTLHLAVSDASGDSAIFEYVGGSLRDPPRPRVPGDDQLAGLRRAAGDQPLLGDHRRHRDAAGHQPRRRQVRARQLLHQGDPADRQRAGRAGERARRDPQRERAAGHQHAGPAEHLVHAVADDEPTTSTGRTSSTRRPAPTRSGRRSRTWTSRRARR